MKKMDNVLI